MKTSTLIHPPNPLFKLPLKPKPTSFIPSTTHSHSHSHAFSLLRPRNFPSFTRPTIIQISAQAQTNNTLTNAEDEEELVIEACVTKTLPPALTLQHGLVALKDALHEFKVHPPSTPSGLIRFQVAVPPNASALNWFCCQPESSGVFPQFYMAKQSETFDDESHFVSTTRGVFGIGAAVEFRQSSTCSDSWNSFRSSLQIPDG